MAPTDDLTNRKNGELCGDCCMNANEIAGKSSW